MANRVLKEFRIPFIGLKTGTHEFEFVLEKEFFEAFKYSEIENAHIDVDVSLEKQANMMVVDIELSGDVDAVCDRCGDPIQEEIYTKQRLIVKFGEQSGDPDDEIIIFGPAEYELDLSHYLYEYAHLALPAKSAHEHPEQCNQEVLNALKKYSVEDNPEDKWAALKDLHFEDNEPLDDEEE
jgi:uncharacterized protein